MANFELSEYQKNILNFVKNEKGNLLVDAKAGSGKTSTLELIAEELINQKTKCLFLAFNKSIADELQKRLPKDWCLAMTVHSMGLSTIKSYAFKKYNFDGNSFEVVVNVTRLRKMVKEYYDKNFKGKLDFYNATGVTDSEFVTSDTMVGGPNLDEKSLKELHSNLIDDFVELCKYCRYYCINYKQDISGMQYIVDKFCPTLQDYIDDVFDNYVELVINVIDRIHYEFENPQKNEFGKYLLEIDYVDMIYLPLYYNMIPSSAVREHSNIVLVDESQDLSILQQRLIKKLYTGFNRFIFVGDEKQSIYGFAGADTQAIRQLKKEFVLTELPLNICYRCPKNVIKLAQEIVPSIDWNHDRIDDGEVKFVEMEDVISNIQPGDVIIGRKNKELLEIYKLFSITLKKPIKFKNEVLVKQLISSITNAINSYITKYREGTNIQVPLQEHMEDWVTSKNGDFTREEYTVELQSYLKELISHNSGMSIRKAPSTNLEFLKTCMKEYYEFGGYSLHPENEQSMIELYDIILDFMDDYISKSKTKQTIADFVDFLKIYFSGSLNQNLPVISSVHQMKGNETDNLYIYNYSEFPYKVFGKKYSSVEDEIQEVNLKYVAITRAKKNLYLIKHTKLCGKLTGDSVEKDLKEIAKVNYLLNDMK